MARSGIVVILLCYFQISMTEYISDDSSEECTKYGICANFEDYPIELARKLIAQLKTENVIFTDEIKMEVQPFVLRSLVETNMFSFDYDSNLDWSMEELPRWGKLCETIKRSWPPRYARHENGKLKTILNDEVPNQVFNVELCSKSTGSSDDRSMVCRSNTMAQGYEGKCIQKTRLKEMYYIEGNRTAIGYFHVPTCCSCDLEPIKTSFI